MSQRMLSVNTIGQPCEGKLHARLDVAGNGNMVRHAPFLDPTQGFNSDAQRCAGGCADETAEWCDEEPDKHSIPDVECKNITKQAQSMSGCYRDFSDFTSIPSKKSGFKGGGSPLSMGFVLQLLVP